MIRFLKAVLKRKFVSFHSFDRFFTHPLQVPLLRGRGSLSAIHSMEQQYVGEPIKASARCWMAESGLILDQVEVEYEDCDELQVRKEFEVEMENGMPYD